MSFTLSESTDNGAALALLDAAACAVLHGQDSAVGEPAAERTDPHHRHVVLEGRPFRSLIHLNPGLAPEACLGHRRQPASRTLSSRRARSLGNHDVSEARASAAHAIPEGPP